LKVRGETKGFKTIRKERGPGRTEYVKSAAFLWEVKGNGKTMVKKGEEESDIAPHKGVRTRVRGWRTGGRKWACFEKGSTRATHEVKKSTNVIQVRKGPSC